MAQVSARGLFSNMNSICDPRVSFQNHAQPVENGSPTLLRPEASDFSSQISAGPDTGERVIHLFEPVTPALANRVIIELLQYEAAGSALPVHMFLYSPGGCVVSGLAIVDTMNHITAPVFTYGIGFAASMAAVILAAGQKGHRYILPRSRVMIHQASGTAGGTLDNVRATLAFQSELEAEIETLLARVCGRSREEIRNASRVDNWMKAQDAIRFGLVDHILASAPTKL